MQKVYPESVQDGVEGQDSDYGEGYEESWRQVDLSNTERV